LRRAVCILSDTKLINAFLADCKIIELDSYIRNITISIRKEYKLKIPDAIITATALYYNLPLFTFDKDFKKIVQLDLFLFTL
jgi:predicted nucleic acid-binding protein